VGAHSLRRLDGGRYTVVVATLFLVILGAFGGASRADELQQAVVRGAALVAIAAALWPLDFSGFRDARGPTAAILIAYLLLIAQLVPLPPGLWQRIPGHAPYFAVARETGSLGWRPLTLSPDLTLNAIAGLLPATALGLLALMLDLRGRILAAYWLVGIACASAVLGLIQLASGGTAFHLFRTSSADSAVGLFANRNHQAVLMACSLPVVAALAAIRLREGGSSGRILGAAASIAALMAIAIAATGSRMGLLLGAIGLASGAAILALCANWKAVARPVRPAYWVAGIAAALAVIVPISILIARSGAIERLTSSQAIDETRVAALRPMLQAAWSFMPFGAGFGTFEPVYQQFEPYSLLSTIYLNQAHNEPVQLAIEGGVPALALLFLFLLWWLRSSVLAVRSRESAARRAMAMAAVSVTLLVMLSSLVDYPLRTPLLSAVFVMFCVELVRSSHKRSHASRAEKTGRP
jgi:O-antigen ligase